MRHLPQYILKHGTARRLSFRNNSGRSGVISESDSECELARRDLHDGGEERPHLCRHPLYILGTSRLRTSLSFIITWPGHRTYANQPDFGATDGLPRVATVAWDWIQLHVQLQRSSAALQPVGQFNLISWFTDFFLFTSTRTAKWYRNGKEKSH